MTMSRPSAAAEPTAIDAFDRLDLDVAPAAQLRAIRAQAPDFVRGLRDSGTVTALHSVPLVTLPYARRYGLYEACTIPVPYIWFTNRMFVVQWNDAAGITRTLLAEPTDHALGGETPFFHRAAARIAPLGHRVESLMVQRHASVTASLRALGLHPDDVDWLAFDHLHTQDIRRIVGTTTPQADLGYPDRPVPAAFDNARLIVQRAELHHVRDVHRFQERFHQSWTYGDIDESRLHVVDGGDVQLGPGVALMHTPGHTLGNQSLAINAPDRGIFTSSENGISAESYAPAHSRIPGVARWARTWGWEVLPNFNTPEFASWQYNSMVKERLVADPVGGGSPFRQTFPSSQLVAHPLAPGIRPTFVHDDLAIGTLHSRTRAARGETAVGGAVAARS